MYLASTPDAQNDGVFLIRVPHAQLEKRQARLSSLPPLPGKELVENDPKGAEYRAWPTHFYTNIQRTLSGHEVLYLRAPNHT